jgi:hypothetical protein
MTETYPYPHRTSLGSTRGSEMRSNPLSLIGNREISQPVYQAGLPVAMLCLEGCGAFEEGSDNWDIATAAQSTTAWWMSAVWGTHAAVPLPDCLSVLPKRATSRYRARLSVNPATGLPDGDRT